MQNQRKRPIGGGGNGASSDFTNKTSERPAIERLLEEVKKAREKSAAQRVTVKPAPRRSSCGC